MPPPTIDLEPYRDSITEWLAAGTSYEEVRQQLQRTNVQVSDRTLRLRIKSWGIERNKKPLRYNSILQAQVAFYFYAYQLSDEEMVQYLGWDG